MARRALIPLLAAGALAAAGCGLGPGPTPNDTSLLVTKDFGRSVVVFAQHPRISGADTVMRLLQRNARVSLRFGAKFVQSVNGVSGGTHGGDPVDWFFYINGVESGQGAAAVKVHPGDVVWWDNHDWSGAMDTPAVIGSYPEPFIHGIGGKKLPTRVECAPPTIPACNTATNNLVAAGVLAAQGGFEASATTDTLRVLVGTWPALRNDPAAAQLGSPPSDSGVFARMAPGGRTIALYDAHGSVVRTLGAGTGLIAAVRYRHGRPVWVITGTNAAGIEAAATALQQGLLADHFAAVVRGTTITALPLP
jgi:hypothetical protein